MPAHDLMAPSSSRDGTRLRCNDDEARPIIPPLSSLSLLIANYPQIRILQAVLRFSPPKLTGMEKLHRNTKEIEKGLSV